MEDIVAKLNKVQKASRIPLENREEALFALARKLREKSSFVLAENKRDLEAMSQSDPRYDRLLLNEERIEGIASDVEKVARLPNPLGRILEERDLPNGLKLQKISVPLGVVAVIYEARPNVTIDVFSLCFKSGNAVVLKGGKEAEHSNRAFYRIIQEVLGEKEIVYLLPPGREAVEPLLQAKGLVDVCIPRGSQALINFVRSHAHIPVIETGAGIVHTYFDKSGDLEKGKKIIFNAKTRRVSVCNALDTLVIHSDRLKDLPALVNKLQEREVEIFADKKSYLALEGNYPLLHMATPEDFGKEFLDYKMAIRCVSSLDEAIDHIQEHTSRHSEAIIAEDRVIQERFLKEVDAASVYVNASTAFTDGGEFGMGAEIGISTQKLHARGPMGLSELTSYKWLVRGSGQIRS